MEGIRKNIIVLLLLGLIYGCARIVDTNLPDRVYLPQTYSIYFCLSPKIENLADAQRFLDTLKHTLVWEMYLNVPEKGDSYDTLATLETFTVKKDMEGWEIKTTINFEAKSSGNIYPREFICNTKILEKEKAVEICAKRIAYLLEDVLELPNDSIFGKPENNPGDSAELQGGY